MLNKKNFILIAFLVLVTGCFSGNYYENVRRELNKKFLEIKNKYPDATQVEGVAYITKDKGVYLEVWSVDLKSKKEVYIGNIQK